MMTSRPDPVVWCIWDGAMNWAVRKLINSGDLPALSKLHEKGVFAAARPPSPNCQTPPSLATLFTGVWPYKHGITGFSVPNLLSKSNLTDMTNGFERKVLKAETIWEYASRFKKRGTMIHIPWVLDEQQHLPEWCDYYVEGYSNRSVRGGVYELIESKQCISVGQFIFEIYIDNQQAFMSGHNCDIDFTIPITNDPYYHSVYLNNQSFRFAIVRRKSDSQIIFIHTGIWDVRQFPVCINEEIFVGEGLGSAYRNGYFGPRLIDGGTGEAEELFLSTVNLAATYFKNITIQAIKQNPNSDFYICYQPCIDDIQHEMLGWCYPESSAYQSKYADQIWNYISKIYLMADQHLAEVMNQFGEHANYIVSSDHGAAGYTHIVNINEAFLQAGLLVLKEDGDIDEKQTLIIFHPCNNGSIWVNRSTSGNYSETKLQEALRKATEILNGLKYKEKLVVKFIFPRDGDLEAGWSSDLGDLFIAANDGFEFSASITKNHDIFNSSLKNASHSTNTNRSSLEGIFFAKGEKIPKGKDLVKIDNRDVFPFICRQLHITIPANIEGSLPIE